MQLVVIRLIIVFSQ
jgi:hypothetical protein